MFTRDIVSDRISRARNKSHRRSHFLADRRSGANCFSTAGSVVVRERDGVRQVLFASTRNHSRVSPTKRNGCSLRVGFRFPPWPVIRLISRAMFFDSRFLLFSVLFSFLRFFGSAQRVESRLENRSQCLALCLSNGNHFVPRLHSS